MYDRLQITPTMAKRDSRRAALYPGLAGLGSWIALSPLWIVFGPLFLIAALPAWMARGSDVRALQPESSG